MQWTDWESRRLTALRSYDILDTEAEAEFDDLARLAANVCGTPIALISLVDERRQWFKARVNFATESTPRDIAFCASAIRQNDVMVVPDATRDPRFATNPLVAGEPAIRFYAGAPLVNREGHALGTLCVIDTAPRQMDHMQLEALRILARQTMAMIERRRLLRQATHLLREQDEPQAATPEPDDLARRAIEGARLGWWDWLLAVDAVTWGGRFEALLGVEPGTFPGTIRALLELVHPDDREAVDSHIQLALLGEDFDRVRFRTASPGAEARWVEMTGTVCEGSSYEAQRIAGVLRDVTHEIDAGKAA